MNKNKYKELLLSTIIEENLTLEETAQRKKIITEAAKLMLPKKLYRYRICGTNDLDAFLENKIYFNTPAKFNDPYDCLVYADVSLLVKQIEQISIDSEAQALEKMRASTHIIENEFSPNQLPYVKAHYDYVKSLSDEEFILLINGVKSLDPDYINSSKIKMLEELKNVGSTMVKYGREKANIACFSETISSIPMWGHYANSQKGFALEYDAKSLHEYISSCVTCTKRCERWHIVNLLPVLYSAERFDATRYIAELYTWQINNLLAPRTDCSFVSPDALFFDKLYTQKHTSWKYEKEWRLIYYCKENNPDGNFSSVEPAAVYLGADISKANKNLVTSIARAKPNLKLYEMYIDANDKKYKLKYRRIK